MLNLVAGNLISSAVLHSSLPSYWLFVIFLIIGSVGASGLLLLRYAAWLYLLSVAVFRFLCHVMGDFGCF